MIREDVPLRALQAKIFQDLIARYKGMALLVNPTGAFQPGPGQPITADHRRSLGGAAAASGGPAVHVAGCEGAEGFQKNGGVSGAHGDAADNRGGRGGETRGTH